MMKTLIGQNFLIIISVTLISLIDSFPELGEGIAFISMIFLIFQVLFWVRMKFYNQMYMNLPLVISATFALLTIIIYGSSNYSESDYLVLLLISSVFFWLQIFVWLIYIPKILSKRKVEEV